MESRSISESLEGGMTSIVNKADLGPIYDFLVVVILNLF